MKKQKALACGTDVSARLWRTALHVCLSPLLAFVPGDVFCRVGLGR